MAGALALRPQTYREIADDESAAIQAGLVVVVVGIVEAAVSTAVHQHAELNSGHLIYSVLAALIGWLVWSAIVFVVGTKLFEHDLVFRSVLRAVAFTHAPAIVYGVAALPRLTPFAGSLLLLSLLWFVAALVACVQGVMSVSLGRAAAITAAALVVHEVLHQVLRLIGLMA